MKSSPSLTPAAVAVAATLAAAGCERPLYAVEDLCPQVRVGHFPRRLDLPDGSYGSVDCFHDSCKVGVFPPESRYDPFGYDSMVSLEGTPMQVCRLVNGMLGYDEVQDHALRFIDELNARSFAEGGKGSFLPRIAVKKKGTIGDCYVRREVEVNPNLPVDRDEFLVLSETLRDYGVGHFWEPPLLDLEVQHLMGRTRESIRTRFPLGKKGGRMKNDPVVKALAQTPDTLPIPSQWFGRSYVCPTNSGRR